VDRVGDPTERRAVCARFVDRTRSAGRAAKDGAMFEMLGQVRRGRRSSCPSIILNDKHAAAAALYNSPDAIMYRKYYTVLSAICVRVFVCVCSRFGSESIVPGLTCLKLSYACVLTINALSECLSSFWSLYNGMCTSQRSTAVRTYVTHICSCMKCTE